MLLQNAVAVEQADTRRSRSVNPGPIAPRKLNALLLAADSGRPEIVPPAVATPRRSRSQIRQFAHVGRGIAVAPIVVGSALPASAFEED
jgi:hypothetical protein